MEQILAKLPLHSETKVSSGPSVGSPVIVGVDEAGRGPVLGPMVYSAAFCHRDYAIGTLGFADSKKLTDVVRQRLMGQILDELKNDIGYALCMITPRDISTDMLAPVGQIVNLNQQAHDTTIDLIQKILNLGHEISELYVDTVGPPASYQRKLADRFPMIEKVVVEKKADDKFPIVSAASVVAKVTRDYWIDLASDGVARGSGYPGDPKTKQWLNTTINPWYGWGDDVRYSWSTAKDLLKNKGIEMIWEGDEETKASTGDADIWSALSQKDKRIGNTVSYFLEFD